MYENFLVFSDSWKEISPNKCFQRECCNLLQAIFSTPKVFFQVRFIFWYYKWYYFIDPSLTRLNNLLSIENQIGSAIIKFQICDPSCEGIKCFYIWSIIVNHVCFMRVWTLHMTHILPPYYNPSNTSCILWCYT